MNRTKNPLKDLRRLLGTGSKLLSSYKLAELARVPAGTLRSVESGRRAFNLDLQKRLRRRGLDWDSKTKQWHFTYDRGAPLSLPLMESFRRLSRANDLFQDLDAHGVIRRTISLLQQVDESAYRDLLIDLNDALETLRDTYNVDSARKEFDQTALRYQLTKTASGGETLVKGYSWANSPEPHRLLDFSHLQKSSVRLDKSEQDEVPVPVARRVA